MRRILALLALSAAAAVAQTPTISGVVNELGENGTLCPGLLATIYGSNFGTNAANVSVSVGGHAAYVTFVSASQINAELPFEVSSGVTTITVTVGGASSAPMNITLNAASPAFFTQGTTSLAQAFEVTGSAPVTLAAPAHNGDTLFANAVGLGPTSPATPTGQAPATASLRTLPTVTVGGVAASVLFAGIPNGQVGVYQVNFVVPAGVQGTVPLVITVGNGFSSSNTVTIALASVASGPTPTVTGVQNAASFSSQLCPGLLATIYGSNFGTTAANVSFTVGGKPGYVIPPVTASQLLVELPFEASTGATTLTVTVGGVQSAPFNITLSAVSPAFFTQNSSGSGLAVVTAAGAPVTLTSPAHNGDALLAYAVGLGPTSPPTATGAVTVPNPTATLPTLTVGGVSAKVTFAGLTQPGTYQINFMVPQNVQGTQPLVISIGGVSSSTTVTLPVAGLSAVVNNASFAAPGTVSPGSIASVFANSLGITTNNLSVFPGTSSGGVQVTFNGTAAPLFHVVGAASPQQVDLLVPSNLPTGGTVNVQLTTSSAFYANVPITMVPANPGFYRITDPKAPTLVNVIAQFANSAWLALPVSTTANIGLPACSSSISKLSECGQPATPGDTLVLYATGLGLATPNGNPNGTPLPTGQIPPIDGSVLYETPTMPVVTIGGQPATVLFSGLAPGFPGEYQIDVTVPGGIASGDTVPVVLTILGASDSSTTISIQPRPAS